jgi:hypothetical protein
MLILAGLTALAAVPSTAAGQQIGVTARIAPRMEQPDFVDAAAHASPSAARVPAGWGWSVSRGVGGGVSSPPVAARIAPVDTIETAPRLEPTPGGRAEVVTWTFVPI